MSTSCSLQQTEVYRGIAACTVMLTKLENTFNHLTTSTQSLASITALEQEINITTEGFETSYELAKDILLEFVGPLIMNHLKNYDVSNHGFTIGFSGPELVLFGGNFVLNEGAYWPLSVADSHDTTFRIDSGGHDLKNLWRAATIYCNYDTQLVAQHLSNLTTLSHGKDNSNKVSDSSTIELPALRSLTTLDLHGIKVVNLPKLEWFDECQISDVESVLFEKVIDLEELEKLILLRVGRFSLPNVVDIQGDIGTYSISEVAELDLPALVSLGGHEITLEDCTTLRVSSLKSISALDITIKQNFESDLVFPELIEFIATNLYLDLEAVDRKVVEIFPKVTSINSKNRLQGDVITDAIDLKREVQRLLDTKVWKTQSEYIVS